MPGSSTRRVLSVIHGPVYGGAHNQLVMLDPALREAGFETVAVLPPEAEVAARRIEAAGIEVVRLPLSSFRLVIDPRETARAALDARREIGALRRVIRDRHAEIVQVHGVINVHAGIAAQLERVAVVWQILDSRAPMPLRRLVMPAVVRIADAITSWGRGLAAAHPGARSLGERLVVYPPVDPQLAPDQEKAHQARTLLGVPDGVPLVGSIGVRNATKGHEYMVRAAAAVRNRGRERVAFRVLGAASPTHGELIRSIENEARELGILGPAGIDFVDPLDQATTFLQAFDVFAMTSIPHSEGMPTAILEAMACAKPVVSTDVGSVRELVAEGATGFVVAPRDPESVADALVRLLDDRGLRARMGAAGRERAEREFPIARLAERHGSAYRLALAHRAGR